MPEGVDTGEQLMASWDKKIREQAERYLAMARRLDEQTVTETTADQTIRVTISSRGLLTDLSLTEAAGAKGMAELSAQIMATLRRAQARIPELLVATMSETATDEGEPANRLLAEARRLFPAVAADPVPRLWGELHVDADEGEVPPAPPPRPGRPARRRAEDDEEFNGFGTG